MDIINNRHKYKVIICAFACLTVQKYRDQVMKIRETWYKRALKKNMLVLFFLGEEQTDLVGPEYIYLKGVNNDYESASIKQNLGIKYIIDNYDFDFIRICDTDSFLVIDNLEKLLDNYDPNDNIAIGGHGCHRIIDGESIYYLSGGPGILLSNKSCMLLYEYLENMFKNWKIKCIEQNNDYLITACDVAICYYLQKKTNTKLLKEDDKFFHCNYYGYPCHIGKVDDNKIVGCHCMSLYDFDKFQEILKSRNMC